MAYIVNADIVLRVGDDATVQLTADTGSSVDATVLDEIRLSSEGEVNGYLAKRYAVPVDLSAHPDAAGTLKGFTLDLAVYRLHTRRAPANKDVQQMRDNAIEWLKGIAEGKINLPVAVTPAATTADDPIVAWGSKEQNAAGMRDL